MGFSKGGSPAPSPEPPGGDQNRAAMVHAFTWTTCSLSLIVVTLRFYTRGRLTRKLWWDDWVILFAMVLTLIFSVMWSVIAGKGFSRHEYYLRPDQLSEAAKLGVTSRSICIGAIMMGKISVAFLIQRIQDPTRWRKWLLRFISISVFLSGLMAIILLFAQCQPAHALWTPSMIKDGTGHCWNPIPINNYDIVVGAYYTFLDFLLALLPVDIVWRLQLPIKKKIFLCMLLGLGVFAGICAAIKTTQLRTVTKKTDITWKLPEYLLWNALEVNVIIIATCIPTLRPLFLIIFRRDGAEAFLNKKSYQTTPRENSRSRPRMSKPPMDDDSGKSINGDAGKDIPMIDVAEMQRNYHSSTEDNKHWNGKLGVNSGGRSKRNSVGQILQTMEVSVSVEDERARDVKNMV